MTTLVSDDEIYAFLGEDDSDSAYPIIANLRDSIEEIVQNVYCKRTFYKKFWRLDRYDGEGPPQTILNLRNWPIINFLRLCISIQDCINVYNTSKPTIASVSVTDTYVYLYKDGIENKILFAPDSTSVLTIGDMVTAINGIGNGWQADSTDTYLNSYRSDDLIPIFGWNARDRNQVTLAIPYEPEWQFEVYPEKGQVYRSGGFPRGHNNIFCDYTSGYDSTAVPEDLKLAIKILVKHYYQKKDEESYSVTDYSLEGIKMTFQTDIPLDAKLILDKYTRHTLW